MEDIMLFSLNKKMLVEVLPPDKELVVELAEEIKGGFERLIKVLSEENKVKAGRLVFSSEKKYNPPS